jgi:hypothetical protein
MLQSIASQKFMSDEANSVLWAQSPDRPLPFRARGRGTATACFCDSDNEGSDPTENDDVEQQRDSGRKCSARSRRTSECKMRAACGITGGRQHGEHVRAILGQRHDRWPARFENDSSVMARRLQVCTAGSHRAALDVRGAGPSNPATSSRSTSPEKMYHWTISEREAVGAGRELEK